MRCPTCGCENDDKNIQCEVCGTEFDNCQTETDDKKKSIDKNKLIIVSLIVVIIVIIIAIVAVSLTKNDKYDNISNLAVTDNSDLESIAESGTEFEDNTVETTIQPTTELTTFSEAEDTRQKAIDYLEKANSALNNGEREGALQMADAALGICDDEDIKKKYDEIYEYKPFFLYDYSNVLKVDSQKVSIFNYDYSVKSNTNKDYKHCIVAKTSWSSTDDKTDVYYYLSKKYDKLTGTIILPAEDKNTTQKNCYIVIYGDGRELYQSDKVLSGTTEQEFDVNISGIDTLVVTYYCDSGSLGEYAIADFTALKNLP